MLKIIALGVLEITANWCNRLWKYSTRTTILNKKQSQSLSRKKRYGPILYLLFTNDLPKGLRRIVIL